MLRRTNLKNPILFEFIFHFLIGEIIITLYEIGIFKNHVLVLHESFYAIKSTEKALNPNKRSNIINLIQSMAEKVLKEDIGTIESGKFKIFFAKYVPHEKYLPESEFHSSKKIFMYAIGDNLSENSIVKPLLLDLVERFVKGYDIQTTDSLEETSQYSDFTTVIHEVLSDECFSPGDRLKNFLF